MAICDTVAILIVGFHELVKTKNIRPVIQVNVL